MTSTGQQLLDLHCLLDGAGVGGDGTVYDRVKALVAENDRLCRAMEQRAKETDYDRLLASLDEDRGLTLMALADACLDAGREGEAKGWGWLASAGKWPVRTKRGWRWWPATEVERDDYYSLPQLLWDAISGPPDQNKRWAQRPTCRLALQAVADAISSGRWTIGQ